MPLSRKRLLKVVLSIFAVWQLICVFVLPNPDSILYRKLASTVGVYGNTFGFNTTWRFFSPNPLIRLLEYDVFTRNAQGKLEVTAGRFPRVVQEEPNREIYNREMNSGMFMTVRQMMPATFGPLLCGRYPKAEVIALYLRGRVFPSVEKAQYLGQHMNEIGEVTRDFVTDLHCDEMAHD